LTIISHQVASAGIILAGIGVVLLGSVLAPDLLATALTVVLALASVVVLDLLFQLGVLYSFFCVVFGVFGLFLFFKRKKKERRSPADQISPRKAA
jgi:hypothetical protein